MSNHTALMLVVDQSGSMSSIKQESQQAFDELLALQKAEPGTLSVKLVTFNHNVNLGALTDASNFKGLTLITEGMTALHDAMGMGITDLDKEIQALPDDQRPDRVIVVTVTDGQENSSREYAASAVKRLVRAHQEVDKWEFLFLGANQDAVLTAETFGIRAGSALTYHASNEGITKSVAAASGYITATRSGLEASFTDEDRRQSGLTDQQ